MPPFDLAPYRDALLALHNHICPRQILGLRMGAFAGRIFKIELPDPRKRLFCFVETDGCFADGVSVATGCTLGHRTLRLMDEGKIAATFVDLRGDLSRGLRLCPRPDVRQRALEAMPFAHSRWHAMLEAYQVMADDDLLCASEIELAVAMPGLISRPGRRVCCAGCGEEIVNSRERWVNGRTLCAACAGESYWRTSKST
jgi:formylmethanofuran dehydrogenase subunit E